MKLRKNKNVDLENIQDNPYLHLDKFIRKESYSSMKPLVLVNNISHSFNHRNIYQDISFEIYENERLAFLGPNGSGKTLTISTVAGFVKPKKPYWAFCQIRTDASFSGTGLQIQCNRPLCEKGLS